METELEYEDLPAAGNLSEATCIDIDKVLSFICGVAATLLNVPADEAAQALRINLALVKMFAEDKDVPVLLIVAWSEGRSSSRIELFKGIPRDWCSGDETAMAATLIKNSPTLDGSQPLAHQLQILSLGPSPVVDALHTFVYRSFKPLLECHFSNSSAAGGAAFSADASRRDVPGNLVRKKVAELELALRGCQQEIKVTDVVLHDHFPAVVTELTAALASCSSQQDREDVKETFLNKCRASEQLKSVLTDTLKACSKDLSDLAARFDRRMRPSADMTPATEREFWLRMEEVMKKVDEQTRLSQVECTLELVKRLKIQQHIPKQLEEDVANIKGKLETVQKYNILMREFPVGEVESAPDLPAIAAAIAKVFDHMKKHLIRSSYPVARAAQLIEGVSRGVTEQLHDMLRKKNLMDMPYEDLQRLCGFRAGGANLASKGQAAGERRGGGGGHALGGGGSTISSLSVTGAGMCVLDVFETWNDKEREFVSDTSKLRKFQKEVPTDGERVAGAGHVEFSQRIQHILRFRHAHESLRLVITKVTKSSQASGQRGGNAGLSNVQVNALEVLKEAFDVVRAVDVLDTSKEGLDAWTAALEQYEERVDRVETQMTANLRNSLGAAKDAREMLSIFSVFNPLLVRPKIRAAIQEYQNKLLIQVKDDVKALQEKFKRKYAGSEAARLAGVRDLPPLAGSVIWARQIERQLQTYMRRIQDVLGEGWEDHPEGQKLKSEGDAFRDKLDAAPRFKKWQEEVFQTNKDAMTLFNTETFLSNLFRVVTTRRKELVLEVNFDAGQAELVKEVRSLSLLGFKMIPSIEGFAHTLERIYPLAKTISEAIRIYFHASARVESQLEPLLAGHKKKMHCYLKLGVDQRLVTNTKELQRELKRDFERPADKTFLEDFVRKREFDQLQVYSRKLYDCALSFQSKVGEVIAKSNALEAALVDLQTCPLQKQQLHRIMGVLQSIVSELELASYSNLAWWVAQLDKRTEAILLARLEELVNLWILCFGSEEVKEAKDLRGFDASDGEVKNREPTEYLRDLAAAARSRLEIKIKNSLLLVDPPIENARATWINQLSTTMDIIVAMPRIKHTAYSEFSVVHHETKNQTYQGLVCRLPPRVLETAYKLVADRLDECEVYVGSWLGYQALWDLDAATVISKLGDDVAQWLQVVTELRASRSLFDTEETHKVFGAITVDFAKVQSAVVTKFDAWHKEMTSVFAKILQDKIRKMLTDLQNARENLEQFSADKGTSYAVDFLNQMQAFKKDKGRWEELMKSLRSGERTLQKHRFKFGNDWTYVDMIEGEWMAFLQIYSKKDLELSEKIATLQAKVIEWDKAVAEKIKVAVNDWSTNKPIQGDLSPATALDQLSIFQTTATKLQQDHSDIVRAKEALGMEILSGIKLNTIVAEISDLREVWLSLVKPQDALQALGDTAWNAVIPRKVRSSLEEIQSQLRDLPNMARQYAAFEHLSALVKNYLKSNVIIIDLRSQAMKERHWDMLGYQLNIRWNPSDMTLRDVWNVDIHRHEKIFREVLSVAQGELGLEEFLKQLRESWQSYQLDLVSYQQKVSLIRGWEDLFTQLSENINSLSSMRNSPYYKIFEDEASGWEEKLNKIRDTFSLWSEIQRRWVYLEGIFLHSFDIKHQLPLEFSRFKTIDNDFVSLMRVVSKKPLIIDVMSLKDLQSTMTRLDDLLCRIQKSLADYLEGKRSSFPRFYFVGDDDLLEIIGSGKDPIAIQRHFRKMFSGIQQFSVDDEKVNLISMQSAEGEVVNFLNKVSISGDIEVNAWLANAEEAMRVSLSANTEASLKSAIAPSTGNVSEDSLFNWIDSCSSQVAVVALQVMACQKIEADIARAGGSFESSSEYFKSLLKLLADSVLQDLTAIRRKKIEHFIGELVHQQNVVKVLEKKKTAGLDDFSWLYFLRVYYRAAEASPLERVQVLVADASFFYGFEYQGVAERLVQTPLTDKAYLTLTQALRTRMGGSPFGPAGTGKTETVKALANQLGRFVLVFNCDETFDLQAMGRIFLGLCQTGAWGCFDEFNRLEERILSAVSQQILTIQTAVRKNAAEVELIGRSLKLNPSIGIFITMNPGYSGRSNLPDNLKQLFRSISMTKPDSEMIAEIMLYSQGFHDAKNLARKIVPLFKLCSDQLSPCSHYDFGLRSLKSVLVGAGQVKRKAMAASKNTDEVIEEIPIIIKSFCSAVIPKLLPDDLSLLQSLLRDVFPGAETPDFSDEVLKQAVCAVCDDWKFQSDNMWLEIVMQLNQIVNLHHGVMLVGPSSSGKSAAWRVLFEALTRSDVKAGNKPGCFHQIDPKALSKSALYGTLDPTTREWKDGIFTSILREIVDGLRGDKDARQWIVLDGDVDPEWVENLNSVLDDNKLLTLPNGERIVLPGNVRIIFEVQDLQFATLATVSRCGMVWFSQNTITPNQILSRYLACLASAVPFTSWGLSSKTSDTDLTVAMTCSNVFETILARDGLLEKALAHVAGLDHVMVFSQQQALSAFLSLLTAGVAHVRDYNLDKAPLAHNVVEKFIAKHTILSIVWSFGGSLNLQHREAFARWIGGMTSASVAQPSTIAERSLLDYEVHVSDGEWAALESKVPSIEIETHRIMASDVLIPTIDTVRHEQLLHSWLKERRLVLLCGPPGSGKTMTISACLRSMPEAELVSLNFSSTTCPNLLIKTFDHYCTYAKTADGTFLRPHNGGKWLVIFCDEVNLPAPDKYGTQHIISLLRQCVELGGFWHPSALTWVKLERIQFIAACNPPTDAGRTVLSPRFLRHTPLLYVDFPGKESLRQIYGTFCRALLKLFPALRANAQPLTDAMVDYYTACKDHYNRDMQAHYIYSPRELSRWMRAMYEGVRSKDTITPELLVQLVVHEALRLFQDRLVTQDEKTWADTSINKIIRQYFPSVDHEECLARPLLFCNWLTKDYTQVQQNALREFVKARLKVFYEEELNVALVVFNQVLDHVLRIDRVLRQPLGHVLLIGASGAGKTVLSRFVAWHNGYAVFQIKAHRGYAQTDFENDLRKVMKRCGCKGEVVCFIFDESNVLSSGFLELMNALLASGEVPGLFDGDEWPALMQQCREAAQRDASMLDTEEELYKRFIQQVQVNLHIVFTMNPASSEFSKRTATSPALFNRCVIDWFGDWSDDALQQVAQEFTATLDIGMGLESHEREEQLRCSVVNALMFVHGAVRKICERRVKQHDQLLFVTPRHYIDFIQQFVRVFSEKRSEIEDQQLHLNVGLQKMTETQEAVQELSVSLAVKGKELALKEVQANEKLQQMVQDQQEAEKQKSVTAELKTKVELSQKEIIERQAKVHEELAEVEPLVQEAKKAVEGIKKAQLDEVRSMLNPPGGVKMTMEAVCMMIYDVKKPTWDDIRKLIRKDDFVNGILNFDTESFKQDKAKMKALNAFLSDPDFTYEHINKSSKACGPLVKWVTAQSRFATILGSIEPLRMEVKSLQEAGRASEEQLSELTAQGKELEAKIEEYKKEYAMLISETQALKMEMSKVSDKVQRSTRLLHNLLGERDRWQKQTATFGEALSTLVGNLILSSAFLVYFGMFDQETRSALQKQLCTHLVLAKIPVDVDLDCAEYLSTADERLQWHANALPEDSLCVENAVMIKRFHRYPLVIDPSGQAATFLMNQFGNRQITKTSFMDSSFMKHLESAMRFGTALLVTDVEDIDPILNPVLNREISKTGGRVLMRLGDQDIDFSPTFCLYLSTRDSSCRFSPDLCSRVTLINFTVTPGGLQNQCLSTVLKSERPEVDVERCEMLKLQGEYRTRLIHLEKSLLQALSKVQGNILDDDVIITTLERIKTESRDIEDKIEKQEDVRSRVQQVTIFYEPLAQAASRVFFSLQLLSEINPLYQFSVQTFLHIFNRVVTKNPNLDALQDKGARLQVLLQDTFVSAFHHACLSLQERHKLSLALRLAQIRLVSQGQGLDDTQLDLILRGIGPSTSHTAEHVAGFPQHLFSDRQMLRAASLMTFPQFQNLAIHMVAESDMWQIFMTSALADSCIPPYRDNKSNETRDEIAASWDNLLLLSALRPDRLVAGARAFVTQVFGPQFLQVGDADLSAVLHNAPSWQHSFVLTSTAGFDTSARVEAQSQIRGLSCAVIALGSPEGYDAADKAISLASTKGGWVLLKNVHLAVEWLHQIDRKLHRMESHSAFRLFMTMEMGASVPHGLLASAQIIVYEPPAGIKASLQQSMRTMVNRLDKEPVERTRLHLLLSWLHGVVLGRMSYCPLGWSKTYEFSETDLRNAADAIDSWVDRASNGRSNLAPDRIPWEAIRELVALCYGGRIDNEFDELALRSLLQRFFCKEAFGLDYSLVFVDSQAEGSSPPSSSPPIVVPEGRTAKAFSEWIAALPDSQLPAWIGLPPDADMLLLKTRGTVMLEGWLHLQNFADEQDVDDEDEANESTFGKEDGLVPKWSRNLNAAIVKLLSQIPETVASPSSPKDDPVQRCICREMYLGRRILETVRGDLQRVCECLAQSAPTTNEIRHVIARLRRGDLPDQWRRHHQVPAGIKVEQWIADLALRLRRLGDLSSMLGSHKSYMSLRVCLGSLFQPGAFLTATRQWSARTQSLALERLKLVVSIEQEAHHDSVPSSSCQLETSHFVVEGSLLHGAKWHSEAQSLCYGGSEAFPLPPLTFRWLEIQEDEKSADMVQVPVYLNTERNAMLCTVRLAGVTSVPWHELGTAITVWSEP